MINLVLKKHRAKSARSESADDTSNHKNSQKNFDEWLNQKMKLKRSEKESQSKKDLKEQQTNAEHEEEENRLNKERMLTEKRKNKKHDSDLWMKDFSDDENDSAEQDQDERAKQYMNYRNARPKSIAFNNRIKSFSGFFLDNNKLTYEEWIKIRDEFLTAHGMISNS